MKRKKQIKRTRIALAITPIASVIIILLSYWLFGNVFPNDLALGILFFVFVTLGIVTFVAFFVSLTFRVDKYICNNKSYYVFRGFITYEIYIEEKRIKRHWIFNILDDFNYFFVDENKFIRIEFCVFAASQFYCDEERIMPVKKWR